MCNSPSQLPCNELHIVCALYNPIELCLHLWCRKGIHSYILSSMILSYDMRVLSLRHRCLLQMPAVIKRGRTSASSVAPQPPSATRGTTESPFSSLRNSDSSCRRRSSRRPWWGGPHGATRHSLIGKKIRYYIHDGTHDTVWIKGNTRTSWITCIETSWLWLTCVGGFPSIWVVLIATYSKSTQKITSDARSLKKAR